MCGQVMQVSEQLRMLVLVMVIIRHARRDRLQLQRDGELTSTYRANRISESDFVSCIFVSLAPFQGNTFEASEARHFSSSQCIIRRGHSHMEHAGSS